MYYPNLRAEIARRGMTVTSFAQKCGIPVATFHDKINDKSSFTLEEARNIRNTLGADMTIDDLFEKETACKE